MNLLKNVKFTILICFFYLIYTFTFKDVSTINLLLLYLIIGIYLLYNYKILLKYIKLIFDSYLKYVLLSVIICVIAAIFIPIVHGTHDFTYISILISILRNIYKFMPLVILLDKNYEDNELFDRFLQYFILSSIIYMISTIVFIVFPNLTHSWNNIIYDSSYQIYLDNENYITRYGLCGFSGYQISFKFAIASCFSFYFLMKENFLFDKEHLFNYICFIIILIGNSFYGRTGLLVSGILTVVLFFAFLKNNVKYRKWIILFIIFCLIIIIVLYNVSDSFRLILTWMFKPIISLIETGKIYDRSLFIVFNDMIFMPKVKTLAIGDGLYTQVIDNISHIYMATDVGFMRAILFYGCIFTFISYLTVLIPLINLKNSKCKVILSLILISTFIIFEVKGEIFYRFSPIVFIIMLLNINCKKEDI